MINLIIPLGLVSLFYIIIGYYNWKKLKKIRKPGKYPRAVIREIDRLLDKD